MTLTDSPAASASRAAAAEGYTGVPGAVALSDHKAVGRMFLASGALFTLAALVLNVLVGFERIDASSDSLLGSSYFRLFSLGRIGLVFLGLLPLLVGLALVVVPLQIGATSVAFPRAAAASFWGWLVGAGIFVISTVLKGGFGVGGASTTYKPKMVALSVASFGMIVVALLLAAVCLATTVIALRAPGMSLHRVPAFAWSVLVASAIWLLTLPVALANVVLTYVDLRNARPVAFGNVLSVWSSIEWLFHPPQVFAFALPALGILADIVPVATKARLRNYGVLLGAIALFGLLSIGADAQEPHVETQFLYLAVGFALLAPTLAVLGAMLDALGRNRRNLGVPSGALLLALCGVLAIDAGVVVAAVRDIVGFDLLGTTATDGAAALAVFGAIAAALGGLVWWAPKITGRPSPEGPIRAIAPLLLIGAVVVGAAELVSGFLDQPSGFLPGEVEGLDSAVKTLNTISAIGVLVVLAGMAGVLALVGRTLSKPAGTSSDPHGGHTLEWATVSPPPVGNFAEPVATVTSERPLLDRQEGAA